MSTATPNPPSGPAPVAATEAAAERFITRWTAATASERSNSQLFLSELCDVLGVPRPEPSHHSGYSFEHPVTQQNPDNTTSPGWIDLYKRSCFLLESKKFHAPPPEPSELQLALESAGVAARRKPSEIGRAHV